MPRLVTAGLIEIAGKYNLSLGKIETRKDNHTDASVKVGFSFSLRSQDKTDYIEFFGLMKDYNNIKIDYIIESALERFEENKQNGSLYYVVFLDEQRFLKSKNDVYFNSDFYKNIEAYLNERRK